MTLTHRRILYISFFIIFFLTAPLVILWAQGYKFNFKTKTFKKTGVLFLESNPKDAEIYLNNKLQKQKTTARLKNLMPGEYLVQVKKDDYQSWTKKLNVYPGSTTFAQYIRLFKNDLPTINLLTGNDEITTISEQKQNEKIAVIIKQNNLSGLYLLDLDKQNLTQEFQTPQLITQLKLNQEANLVLIKTDLKWIVFDILNKKITELNKLLKLDTKDIVFDQKNNNTLYALSKLGIEKIDLDKQKSSRIISGQIISFDIINNNLYYLEKIDNSCELISSNPSEPDNKKVIQLIPCAENFKFFNSPQQIINFIDTKNNLLYVLDPDKKIFTDDLTIIPNIKTLSWHSNKKSMLFSNDYEIWTYQQRDNKFTKNLVTRLSTKIKDALWFKFDTHLLYFTDNGLFVTETIDEVRPVIVFYSKIKNPIKIFFNNDGDSLFWLTQNGIYQSEIQ